MYDAGRLFSLLTRINAKNRKEVTRQVGRRPNQQKTTSQIMQTVGKLSQVYREQLHAFQANQTRLDVIDDQAVAAGHMTSALRDSRRRERRDAVNNFERETQEKIRELKAGKIK
jgi:hypothetical protein